MNSDVEGIEPFPIPLRDIWPSGFVIPPLPPRQSTPPPPTCAQPFPEAALRGWMLNQQKWEELIAKLHTSNALAALQLENYTKMKCTNLNCAMLEEDVHALRRHIEEEVKKTKLQIEWIEEALQDQQNVHKQITASFISSIPHDIIQQNAPHFFSNNTPNDEYMDKGICPHTYKEFKRKAPQQLVLYYSQSTAATAIYKESRPGFYSCHVPHTKYSDYLCEKCHLYGHVKWDCPWHICDRCKSNCGHKPKNCKCPCQSFDKIIIIVDTPELTPEPQDFPLVASTSLFEPTNAVEGAPLTTNL